MSDAPRTRVDLIDRALECLGVLVDGQAPTAAMREKIDKILDGHMASLRVEEIVYVANYGTSSPPAGGEIAAEHFLPIADTLAWRAAPTFNLAGDPALKAQDILARDELKRLTRPARSRRMLRVDPQTRMTSRAGAGGNFTSGT